MELGSLQKKWIESLRANPDRQCIDVLGTGSARSYKACCLGELHICYHRVKSKKMPFSDGVLSDGMFNDGSYGLRREVSVLSNSYDMYGLRDDMGRLYQPVISGNKRLHSLAEMNDRGWTWLMIADYVDKNPENVFLKSV